MSFAPTASRVLRIPLVQALAFVLLSLVAYARTLNGWFLSDDVMLAVVVPDGEHVDWGHVRRVFWMDWGARGEWAEVRYYRPLVILSQAIDALFWGLRPVGYHVTNTILHGVNGFLLSRVALAAGASAPSAFFAGTAFVLFPWNLESVAWISGRTDVLATLWTLASLWVYLLCRGATGARRAKLLGGALALFSLGLLSKEPAIALPLLVVGADLVLPGEATPFRDRAVRVLGCWAAFAAVTLGYLWLRSIALGNVWGGEGRSFYGKPGEGLLNLRERWEGNLLLLLSPFNREVVGTQASAYSTACAVALGALVLSFLNAVRTRTVRFRVALASLVWFLGSVAPFAPGILVHTNLTSSRLMYLATSWACLLFGVLAVPVLRAATAAAALAYLGLCATLLFKNQAPWIEAAATMRGVTRTYAAAFGAFSGASSGETIEGLPATHRGAYLALYNAGAMSRPFILEPPRPEAVASQRAVFHRRRGELRVVPDAAFGAAERLVRDRAEGDWLWPLDGSALDTAGLEKLVRTGERDGVRTFRVKSRRSWFVIPANRDGALPPLEGAPEHVYFLVRPAPPVHPQIFWVSRPGEQFGAPRFFQLRPELRVEAGRVVQRQVDGFFVYAAELPRTDRSPWAGIERVKVVRLDPSFRSGEFEVGFFGIARGGAGSAGPR